MAEPWKQNVLRTPKLCNRGTRATASNPFTPFRWIDCASNPPLSIYSNIRTRSSRKKFDRIGGSLKIRSVRNPYRLTFYDLWRWLFSTEGRTDSSCSRYFSSIDHSLLLVFFHSSFFSICFFLSLPQKQIFTNEMYNSLDGLFYGGWCPNTNINNWTMVAWLL